MYGHFSLPFFPSNTVREAKQELLPLAGCLGVCLGVWVSGFLSGLIPSLLPSERLQETLTLLLDTFLEMGLPLLVGGVARPHPALVKR